MSDQLWLAFPRVRGCVGASVVHQVFCGVKELLACKIKSSESFAAWVLMDKSEFKLYCQAIFDSVPPKAAKVVQRSVLSLRISYLWELEDERLENRFIDLEKQQSQAIEDLFESGCASARWGKYSVNFTKMLLEGDEKPLRLRRRCCVTQRPKPDAEFVFRLSPLVADATWSVFRLGQRIILSKGHSFLLETLFRSWITAEVRDEHIAFNISDEIGTLETCSTAAWTLIIDGTRCRLGRRLQPTESQCSDPLASAVPLLNIDEDLRSALNQFSMTNKVVLNDELALSTVRKLVDEFSVSPLAFTGSSEPQQNGKSFSICIDDEWVRLCPLNEWLMNHDSGLLFLFGEWLEVVNRCAVFSRGTHMWIDDGRHVVRLLCSGSPVCVPTALLPKDCPRWITSAHGVIVTGKFTATDVLNAFFGTVVTSDVAEFFALPSTNQAVNHSSNSSPQFTLHSSIASALAGDRAKFTIEAAPSRPLPRDVQYGFNFPVVA